MVIIGSTAAAFHGVYLRKVKDLDLAVPPDTVVEGYDCIPMPENILAALPCVETDNFNLVTRRAGKLKYATLNALLTIKMSHFHLPISWEKTKSDILMLLHHGAKPDITLLDNLTAWWDQTKGRSKEVSLAMSKEEFFATGKNFQYDHDQLHVWAAGNGLPIYQRCLEDNQEVLISWSKFMDLSFEDRLQMIKEEIAVIACERWLLNKNSNIKSPVVAWQNALQKVCTTLMKGKFRQFAILNLQTFIKVDWTLLQNILKHVKQKENQMLEEFIEHMKSHVRVDGNDQTNIIYSIPDDVELIEQEGGEKEGEYAYSVWKWKNELFRLDYSYYSYGGYENVNLDDMRSVKKVERTVAFYE